MHEQECEMLLNKKRTVYQGGLYVARYTGRNGVLEAVGTYLWHFLNHGVM